MNTLKRWGASLLGSASGYVVLGLGALILLVAYFLLLNRVYGCNTLTFPCACRTTNGQAYASAMRVMDAQSGVALAVVEGLLVSLSRDPSLAEHAAWRNNMAAALRTMIDVRTFVPAKIPPLWYPYHQTATLTADVHVRMASVISQRVLDVQAPVDIQAALEALQIAQDSMLAVRDGLDWACATG